MILVRIYIALVGWLNLMAMLLGVHLLLVLIFITCVSEQHIKQQELLAPAFGSTIRNVSLRCLQHRVRRRAEVISGQPSSEEWGWTDCPAQRRAPTCCNWIGRSPSVIVWPCSLSHPLPLFLGRFRYVLACNKAVYIFELLMFATFLGLLLCWEVLLKSTKSLIPLCFMDPPSFARCVFPSDFSSLLWPTGLKGEILGLW